MKKPLLIIGTLLAVILLVAISGMYKFNDLANQLGYDVDGNKITTPTTEESSQAIYKQQENDLDAARQTLITNMAGGYERAKGVWIGYRPADYPVVVPFKQSADSPAAEALAVNHPNPDALGDAEPLSVEGTPFKSLHRITNLNEDTQEKLGSVQFYHFGVDLGDTSAFVQNAIIGNEVFDPTSPDWTAMFLHELFHRYQTSAFKGVGVAQDVEGYAYTAENLELAKLEDRVLAAAVGTDDEEELRTEAKRFAAIRLTRREADDRVALDDSQERFEGIARWIEHRTDGGTGYTHTADNYDRDLNQDFSDSRIKETFGFGRFYATGAAIVELLNRLGVEDVVMRIEAGETPANVLIDALGVTSDETPDLVASARTAHDPQSDLAAAAETAAATAAEEGSVFGDMELAEGQSGNLDDDGGFDENNRLTDEQMECLDDADVAEGEPISEEVFSRCVGDN